MPGMASNRTQTGTRPSGRSGPHLPSTPSGEAPVLFRLPAVTVPTVSMPSSTPIFDKPSVESRIREQAATRSPAVESYAPSVVQKVARDLALAGTTSIESATLSAPERVVAAQPQVAAKSQPTDDAESRSWWEHWSSGIVLLILILALVTAGILAIREPEASRTTKQAIAEPKNGVSDNKAAGQSTLAGKETPSVSIQPNVSLIPSEKPTDSSSATLAPPVLSAKKSDTNSDSIPSLAADKANSSAEVKFGAPVPTSPPASANAFAPTNSPFIAQPFSNLESRGGNSVPTIPASTSGAPRSGSNEKPNDVNNDLDLRWPAPQEDGQDTGEPSIQDGASSVNSIAPQGDAFAGDGNASPTNAASSEPVRETPLANESLETLIARRAQEIGTKRSGAKQVSNRYPTNSTPDPRLANSTGSSSVSNRYAESNPEAAVGQGGVPAQPVSATSTYQSHNPAPGFTEPPTRSWTYNPNGEVTSSTQLSNGASPTNQPVPPAPEANSANNAGYLPPGYPQPAYSQPTGPAGYAPNAPYAIAPSNTNSAATNSVNQWNRGNLMPGPSASPILPPQGGAGSNTIQVPQGYQIPANQIPPEYSNRNTTPAPRSSVAPPMPSMPSSGGVTQPAFPNGFGAGAFQPNPANQDPRMMGAPGANYAQPVGQAYGVNPNPAANAQPSGGYNPQPNTQQGTNALPAAYAPSNGGYVLPSYTPR